METSRGDTPTWFQNLVTSSMSWRAISRTLTWRVGVGTREGVGISMVNVLPLPLCGRGLHHSRNHRCTLHTCGAGATSATIVRSMSGHVDVLIPESCPFQTARRPMGDWRREEKCFCVDATRVPRIVALPISWRSLCPTICVVRRCAL